MEGQIIVRKRLVSALLLQYQLLFLCNLWRKHRHLRKKKKKKILDGKYIQRLRGKKPYYNTSKRLKLFD